MEAKSEVWQVLTESIQIGGAAQKARLTLFNQHISGPISKSKDSLSEP